MLVLSRKKDEKIIINDSITIMVVEIWGGKVRLGIDAPRDITIHREEVYEAIKREKQGAEVLNRVVDQAATKRAESDEMEQEGHIADDDERIWPKTW